MSKEDEGMGTFRLPLDTGDDYQHASEGYLCVDMSARGRSVKGSHCLRKQDSIPKSIKSRRT